MRDYVTQSDMEKMDKFIKGEPWDEHSKDDRQREFIVNRPCILRSLTLRVVKAGIPFKLIRFPAGVSKFVLYPATDGVCAVCGSKFKTPPHLH